MSAYPLQHEGTGATITFGTSAFTAEIVDIKRTPRKRDAIETTYLGTTGSRTYIPSTLWEPGEYDLTVHFNPDVRYAEATTGETVTVTFPVIGSNATPSTDASQGFVTEALEFTAMVGKLMEGKVKVKLTGPVAHVNTAT